MPDLEVAHLTSAALLLARATASCSSRCASSSSASTAATAERAFSSRDRGSAALRSNPLASRSDALVESRHASAVSATQYEYDSTFLKATAC